MTIINESMSAVHRHQFIKTRNEEEEEKMQKSFDVFSLLLLLLLGACLISTLRSVYYRFTAQMMSIHPDSSRWGRWASINRLIEVVASSSSSRHAKMADELMMKRRGGLIPQKTRGS